MVPTDTLKFVSFLGFETLFQHYHQIFIDFDWSYYCFSKIKSILIYFWSHALAIYLHTSLIWNVKFICIAASIPLKPNLHVWNQNPEVKGFQYWKSQGFFKNYKMLIISSVDVNCWKFLTSGLNKNENLQNFRVEVLNITSVS